MIYDTFTFFKEMDLLENKIYTTICATDPNYLYGECSGTSAACPHVCGIAALMLSVDPILTQSQVSDIIEQTSRKVGNYSYQTTSGKPNGTWNIEMGYGLVDAYAATCYVYNNYPLTLSNTTIEGTNNYTRNQITISNSTTFDTNSIIAIKTGNLTINGPFAAKAGGSLTITNYTCQ